MDVAIQLMSSHPVLTQALQRIRFHSEGFSLRILPPTLNQTQVSIDTLWFFLLDACSLPNDLGPLITRCRSNCPRSKFLALLPPTVNNFANKIRLLCRGLDGFVDLHEEWQTELPRAIDSILQGQLWVSRDVLETFMRHETALLESQLRAGHLLTAREEQVVHMVMRGLANKEIANSLEISERTVKFHVSNILSKLQLDDRRELFPDRLASKVLAAKV